jgi:hypothetical protein
MAESVDDARLRAEEAQMRHALGLDSPAQPLAPPANNDVTPSPAPERLTLHRPPRRFVKDGEVPVTVVRRTPADGASGLGPAAMSQLEAARQTIRSQAVATERAERALADAQATIRDLRTKLEHERMARDETLQAISRAEADRDAALAGQQTLRAELAAERIGREKVEQELQRAIEARHLAEAERHPPTRRGRPPKVAVASEVPEPPVVPRKRGRPRKIIAEAAIAPAMPKRRGRPPKARIEEQAELAPARVTRRRGRPPKVRVEAQAELGLAPAPVTRRRGRPPKVRVEAQAELGLAPEPVARRRGRPPKGSKPVKWRVKGRKARAD